MLNLLYSLCVVPLATIRFERDAHCDLLNLVEVRKYMALVASWYLTNKLYNMPYRRRFRNPFGKKSKAMTGYVNPYGPATVKRFYGKAIRNRYLPYGTGMEVKFLDTDEDDAVMSQSGLNHGSLALIVQGTGDSARIGRKVQTVSISSRFHLFIPTTTDVNNTHDQVRFWMVLDKQANGGNFVGSDFLTSGTDILAFNNLTNKSRFRILWTRSFALQSMSGAGDGTTNKFGEQNIYFNVFTKVKVPIEFSGTAGTIANTTSNTIAMFSISQHGRAGFSSRHRLRFIG